MIETVVAYQLAVGETLRIQKKRLMPGAGNPNIGRISIVSGIQKSPARQVKANSSTDNWKNNLPLA